MDLDFLLRRSKHEHKNRSDGQLFVAAAVAGNAAFKACEFRLTEQLQPGSCSCSGDYCLFHEYTEYYCDPALNWGCTLGTAPATEVTPVWYPCLNTGPFGTCICDKNAMPFIGLPFNAPGKPNTKCTS